MRSPQPWWLRCPVHLHPGQLFRRRRRPLHLPILNQRRRSPGCRRNKWRSRIIRASVSASCSDWRNTRWFVRREPLDLPTANGAITAVKALDASRISAGTLTASRLFTHAGAGGNFTQLITDFGRTHNLVLTQELQEQAAKANSLATKRRNRSSGGSGFLRCVNRPGGSPGSQADGQCPAGYANPGQPDDTE